MTYNPHIHHRRSIRLRDYDYSQAGAYFVTICTQNKECLFGNVVNGTMQLNDMGTVAKQCWNAIPQHFPNVLLDEFVVMPNHVHGIVMFTVGANNYLPSQCEINPNRAKDILPLQSLARIPLKNNSPQHGTSITIGSVIRGLKIGVTKWARANGACHTPWQHNYYEHIVRNEHELHKIREYIINNPLNWETDENYV